MTPRREKERKNARKKGRKTERKGGWGRNTFEYDPYFEIWSKDLKVMLMQ